MKVNVPDPLKADIPATPWGKILSATPVIMAVVSTLLAGLSSSEMTRAQYDRSYAAQLQSKAGDQWNFFQGKKLRGALQRSELDLMTATTEVHPLERAELLSRLAGSPAGAAFDTPAGQRALESLVDGKLPGAGKGAKADPAVGAALASVDDFRSDAEIAALVSRVGNGELEEALRGAQAESLSFDAAIKPVGDLIDRAEKQLNRPGTDAPFRRDFVAARLAYNALRYDTEARLNQAIAALYDLQVRKGNASAERHHYRSQEFFYGMLVSQLGVIISTMAMAARQRNLLWSFAAAAGAAAIAFSIYVYACL